MRRIFAICCLASCVSVTGCGVVRNWWVEIKGGTVMLDTMITLYACDGDTIQAWHTRANVTTNGGEAWWVDDSGIQHHIAGTFTVHGK